MKPRTFLSTVSLIILSLSLTTSCQKEDSIQSTNCSTCPPLTITRSVNLQVSNWTTNGDGSYRADFSAALQKEAGDYNEILKVAEETENGEVEIGIATNVPGGTLTRFGTLLVFKSIGYGQTVFSPMKIRVWVN